MDLRAGVAAMRSVARSVQQLARVPSQAAAKAAPKIETAIRQEFADGHDPYGNPWAPLQPATVERGRTPPPLTDTGALGDVSVTPSRGAGISIKLGSPVGAFHQVGTKNMPARPILPTGDLPKEWRAAITDAVGEAIK